MILRPRTLERENVAECQGRASARQNRRSLEFKTAFFFFFTASWCILFLSGCCRQQVGTMPKLQWAVRGLGTHLSSFLSRWLGKQCPGSGCPLLGKHRRRRGVRGNREIQRGKRHPSPRVSASVEGEKGEKGDRHG